MEGAHPPPSNNLGGLFDVVGSKTKLRYASSVATTSTCSTSNTSSNTVDGRNPIPVDRQFILEFTRFYASQVVEDFFHQQT